MVLDFSGALFKNTGLQQDTGLLSERWNQDGSTQTSVAVAYANADGTLLTVSSGKVFYLKAITFRSNFVGPGEIDDNATAKIYLYAPVVNTPYTMVFDVPISFSTSVNHIFTNGVVGDGTWTYTVSGWEEDA